MTRDSEKATAPRMDDVRGQIVWEGFTFEDIDDRQIVFRLMGYVDFEIPGVDTCNSAEFASTIDEWVGAKNNPFETSQHFHLWEVSEQVVLEACERIARDSEKAFAAYQRWDKLDFKDDPSPAEIAAILDG